MNMVRLQFPIESDLRAVPATQMVGVRNLSASELEALHGADDNEILAAYTGLSPDQVVRLTPTDRANIIAARRAIT